MDPSTSPWRTLEAPSPEPQEEQRSNPPVGGATLKIGAVIVAALACALIAVALAVGSGGGSVVVDGATADPGRSGAASDARAGGTPDGALVVEIVGAVARPGVFHLPAGSRVGDLVTAAGGYGPRFDTARAQAELNLAAALRDGDQVRVPSRDDGGASPGRAANQGGARPSGGAGGTLLDLNSATAAELDALPGIGPATSAKILAAREEARFAAVEDLRTRGLVGEKTFEKLRPLITVR